MVRDGRTVLSSVVFSQTALHRPYGGVVPEIASRSHVENLPGVIAEAVGSAGLKWADLDAVAAEEQVKLQTGANLGEPPANSGEKSDPSPRSG